MQDFKTIVALEEEGMEAHVDFYRRIVRLTYKNRDAGFMLFSDVINLASAIIKLSGIQKLSDMDNVEDPASIDTIHGWAGVANDKLP